MADAANKLVFHPFQMDAMILALKPFVEESKIADAAQAVLTAYVNAAPKEHKFSIRIRKGGSEVVMKHEDKGDMVPGFDKKYKRFEAYTSYFEWGDKPEQRTYSQVDKRLVDSKGADFRLRMDMKWLESLGFDTKTIVELVN